MTVLDELRIMGTGCAVENLDDCVYMGEETIRKFFTQICVDVMEMYGGRFYNRFHTKKEMENK